jgi:hypothetical protein
MRGVDRVAVPRVGKLKGRARMGLSYNKEDMVEVPLNLI